MAFPNELPLAPAAHLPPYLLPSLPCLLWHMLAHTRLCLQAGATPHPGPSPPPPPCACACAWWCWWAPSCSSPAAALRRRCTCARTYARAEPCAQASSPQGGSRPQPWLLLSRCARAFGMGRGQGWLAVGVWVNICGLVGGKGRRDQGCVDI